MCSCHDPLSKQTRFALRRCRRMIIRDSLRPTSRHPGHSDLSMWANHRIDRRARVAPRLIAALSRVIARLLIERIPALIVALPFPANPLRQSPLGQMAFGQRCHSVSPARQIGLTPLPAVRGRSVRRVPTPVGKDPCRRSRDPLISHPLRNLPYSISPVSASGYLHARADFAKHCPAPAAPGGMCDKTRVDKSLPRPCESRELPTCGVQRRRPATCER
jgi:hypothetical protein